MKLTIALTLALAALGNAANVRPREYYEKAFVAWMVEHGHSLSEWSAAEFVSRLNNFADHEDKITQHNAGNHTFTMAHNQFSHMTLEEWRDTLLSTPMQGNKNFDVAPFTGEGVEKADSIDWVEKGAVTAVKDQGQCGSCWSFSTTGGLEGAYYLKNKDLQSFSEQNLVSCDTTDDGCSGGLMDNAFKWIEKNGGLCSEGDYPYESAGGQAGTCQKSCTIVDGSAPTKFTDVEANEDALAKAVSQQPISIAIDAQCSAFMHYSSGVLTTDCGTQLDHGVLLVGYGTDPDSGKDYWKVKNSWATTWGEEGYVRLEKGLSKTGINGIATSASFPTL